MPSNDLNKFLGLMIKHSSANVPHPLPLIKKKAEMRLSTDGLISFNIILKEWDKVKQKDKKEIAKLLILSSHDVFETSNISQSLSTDVKDMFEFVQEHPEYANHSDESSLMNEIQELFE